MQLLRICTSTIFMFVLVSVSAQSSFSVSTQYVEVTKPADFAFFYDFVQFENLTGDTLWMRWEKTGRFGNTDSVPAGWETSIQDPNEFFLPAADVSGADFFLPPVAGSTDKFLLQVYPNNIPASYELHVKFFPLSDPADSTIVTFNYEATPVNSSYETFSEEELSLQFIPSNQTLQVSNHSTNGCEVLAFNAHGNLLKTWQVPASSDFSDKVPAWSPGVYYLLVRDGQRRMAKPICLLK